ncbi:MAG TPA: hypothetical protein VGR06_16410 [Actinophytocola sp.]|jgi:hypothetical protein|uniref:hypothetical protein n=1 Tax=Actinophytocola sp. TaxID=1872138 RepID=UPI002DFB11B4|nr:hypothetical protein [Actinophytocola sp.]
MPRRNKVNWQAVEAAAQPHSVIARWQLNQLDVSDRMIWERTRPGGIWKRLLPGVISLHNGDPSWLQQVEAALRYARRGAMVTGLAAARLYGLRRVPPTDRVHLLVPIDKQPATYGFVVVERTTRPPRPELKGGFPVAPLTRAVLDGSRRLLRQDDVDALIAEAVQKGLTTPRKLADELDTGSRRGAGRPRVTIEAMFAGARSKAEADAYRLVDASCLPRPVWNPTLIAPDGSRLPTPDGWFDDVALAWEIDSLEFHLSPKDYERTLRRHAIMTAAGIVVLHTLPSQLVREPAAVLNELSAAYRQAALRPRPPIERAT